MLHVPAWGGSTMTGQFGAAAAILATWLLLGLALTGVGAWARRLAGLAVLGADAAFASFWVGWAAALAILQVWHLWLPVRWPALLLVGSVGGVGLVAAGWLRLGPALARAAARRPLVTVLALAVTAWVAYRCTAPVANYDLGLYHLQSVRWAHAFPVVRGLGNLHGRLGYNSAFFLFAAMLDVGPWAGRVYLLANGFLLGALAAQAAVSVGRVLRQEGGSRRPYDLFNAVLLAPLLATASAGTVASLATDLPVFVLTLVVTGLLLRLLGPGEAPAGREGAFVLGAIAVLSAAGLTVKLSFAPMGAAVALVAAGVWLWGGEARSRRGRTRALAVAAACGLALVVPWMVRGILLTGYVAFPSTLGAVAVPWRVPRSLAINESRMICSWSRRPDLFWTEVLGRWTWLRTWVWKLPGDVSTALELALAATVVALGAGGERPSRRRGGAALWWALLPPSVSVVVWFVTAPNPRFIQGSLWALAAVGVALAVVRVQPEAGGEAAGSRLAVAALWMALFLFVSPLRQPILVPPAATGGLHSLPQASVAVRTTSTGLQVNVPVGGDQCWNAPLPCTPYFHPELRLLEDGDLGKGFALDPRVAYVDNFTIEDPPGLTSPRDLGVRLLGGWYPEDPDTGTRWMRSPARILLYTERARTITLALTPGRISTGERLGDSGRLLLTINGRSLAVVEVHRGEVAELSVPLVPDYNILALGVPAGNLVPGTPVTGAPEAEPLGAELLSIKLSTAGTRAAGSS